MFASSGDALPPLWRSFLHTYSRPIFEHARVQPFLDEPHHAPVRYAMFDELHQPFVRDRIEGSHDTLPILSTFPSGSRLSEVAIRLKQDRSRFSGQYIATDHCISS